MRAVMLCMLLLGGVSARAEQPQVRQIVAPGYPLLAWAARLQGSAIMELEIGPDGTVQSAKGSGTHPLLLREAEKNASEWTFGGFTEGASFPIRFKLRYIYRLEGEPAYPMPQPRVVITLPDIVQIVVRPPEPQISEVDHAPESPPRSQKK
jgi:hypothetical protein